MVPGGLKRRRESYQKSEKKKEGFGEQRKRRKIWTFGLVFRVAKGGQKSVFFKKKRVACFSFWGRLTTKRERSLRWWFALV